MKQSIGILGVGTYLPPEVRRNDFWPDHLVARWRERALRRVDRMRADLANAPTEAARKTMEAIIEIAADPFGGARERRVMQEGMNATDMETRAAEQAIARSGVAKDQIDLVLSYTMIPDFINVPSACVVHKNLGLEERCTTLAVDAVCNSFLMQLTLAQGMIASGAARYALLTQSSALTHLPASGEVVDAAGGDGAAAVVVGPVSGGRGILSYSHHADGSLAGALVCGVPDGRWYDGRCVAYSADNRANANMIVRLAERAGQVVGESLEKAGIAREEVAFYASHQALHWLRRLGQECSGLTHARYVDHFEYTGTISAANLPFQLAVAEREGLLRPGDVVACYQGGTGMTWSGMAMRWGS
jgi:3-oxoacyl-[acyl-carrier-protein] synthase-3